MKRILIFVFAFCGLTVALQAQYIPNNAQTFQFAPVFNPAFTGVENFGDLKLSYRYQWSGFGQYSPKFINLSYNIRIKQPLDLTYNSLRLSDPNAGKPEHLPKSKGIIHGFGANVFQSQVGVLKSIGGSVNYAINYPITKKYRIALGVSALIENRKLDVGEVTVRDPDPFYNHLLQSSNTQTDLNIRSGLLLYSQNFYAGISYLPLVNMALQSSELSMNTPFYRGSFQAGYSFPLNNDVTLKPSVFGLLQMKGGMAIDYSVKAYVQNKIWMGLTYRDIQSGVAIFGFNINELFTVSYAYEMSLGNLRQFNDGSHELVLSMRLNNYKKISQYIW
jgi:type IX secretion system PorP/SprF family membrane protein